MRTLLFLLSLFLWMQYLPLSANEEFVQSKQSASDSLDPVIVSVISEINPDSLMAVMQHLQGYGSRYKLLDNRRDIADWLAEKFLSIGINDVSIDSFLCHVKLPVDTTLWQYNVVAKLPGIHAPDEEDLIGAHYDSYSVGYMTTNAPGADDNASGAAGVLELARVMKQEGYQPESTITFALFAAEEFGGQGSEFMAKTARETGRDIRYMLNLDMIANNPDSLHEVLLFKFHRVESAGRFAANVMKRYTGLNIEFSNDSTNTDSDSYFFWLFGFPTTFFFETEFSPNWHTQHDTLGACNISYCAEVVRGACATLMEDQLLPYPRSFTARSSKENIKLTWLQTKNSNVAGYNIYRSVRPDTGFVKLNSLPLADSFYIDISVGKGEEYYYFLKTVNDSLRESVASEKARGVRMAFTDTLLVVNSVADNSGTPDEIIQYYSSLLDSIPFTWCDVNKQHPFSLHLLGIHQNVWWMANDFDYTPGFHPSVGEFGDFFRCGGNMLLTAFLPSLLMDEITDQKTELRETSILHSFFKADSSIRKASGLFYMARPVTQGFDTLRVDPDKEYTPGLPGQLQNIEVYAPGNEGSIIYRYDSHYAPPSPLGALKDKPVGLDYMGSDYKTILLSFPLFFIDTSQARAFIQDVWKNKFTHPTAMEELKQVPVISDIHLYPNPSNGKVTLTFLLSRPEELSVTLYSCLSDKQADIYNGEKSPGKHQMTFPTEWLPAGIYFLVLRTQTHTLSQKLVIL